MLSDLNGLPNRAPRPWSPGLYIDVQIDIVGMAMMIQMRDAQHVEWRDQHPGCRMPDQLVEPTQAGAGPGNDIVLRFMGGQINQSHIDHRNRKGGPKRQQAGQDQRPKAEPYGEVSKRPDHRDPWCLTRKFARNLVFELAQFGFGKSG